MMKNKKTISKNLIADIFRIANKISRIEAMPIVLDDDESLSTREIHTIQAVGDKKVVNVTDVGDYFGVTKGAASQMLSKLVRKGFVSKNISAHSNKEYELFLTEKGKLAYDAHEKQHGKEFTQLLSYLSELDEQELFFSEKVVGMFEEVIDRRLND